MSVVGHVNGLANGALEQNDQGVLDITMVDKEDKGQLHHVNGNAEKCVEDNSTLIVDGENVCLQSPSSECSGKSFVVKVPRANSKLILQNMEEVLNSVKKKHRQKHRRKKEQKKLAMLAEAANEKAEKLGKTKKRSSASSSTSQDVSKSSCESGSGSSRKSIKKPLQEQQTLQQQSEHLNLIEKGKSHNSKRRKTTTSPMKSIVSAETGKNSNGILDHLVCTPRKNQEKCNKDIQHPVQENSNAVHKSKPPTNAFEVMMNARNKSIGSNTPGKEPNITDISPSSSNTVNEKRKLLLQTWADRKGGLKRKMDEEMRAAYVEERLEVRAKRLKKMLTTGKSGRDANNHASTPKAETNSKKEQQSVSTTSNKMKQRGKISSRRSRRLSSSDSVDSLPEKSEPLDSETVEFLSKLSSPTKKRDSLLGYFTKITSPTEGTGNSSAAASQVSRLSINVKNKEKSSKNSDPETPRTRGRLKSKKPKSVDDEETKIESLESSECVTHSSQSEPATERPRRACADKGKYDYSLESENSSRNKRKINIADEQRRSKFKKTRNSSNDNDANHVDIIDLDSSSSFSIPNEAKTPKKLAPLFMRSVPVPKPSPDPEALKARQEFLRSGVPDKLKLEQERQKQYDQTFEEGIELFPKISHMQQWSKDEEIFLAKKSSKSKMFHLKDVDEPLKLDKRNETSSSRSSGSSRKGKTTKGRCVSLIGITNCTLRDFRPDRKSIRNGANAHHLVSASFSIVSNKRQIIKSWKVDFDRFPTYKCYNQLRTKYRFFSALDSAQDTEQVTESFVVTRSTRRSLEMTSMSIASQEEDVKPPDTAPNGELLFTEKYKPMLFEQVLVNFTPVSQLRDFLASWANGSGVGSARNSQNIDDSMDFMNDSNSSQQTFCNSVVLLGPASSGKTNAVFTLANEMNFNVLEINAGMKRTGKKLTQELLEATQSHQIRNESTGGSAVKSKAQKNLLKMSLSTLKGRKQTSGNSSVNETELSTVTDINVRKCLILIEDADIIFEQTDAGFTDAVYTLAATSKRPVIIIATNPNCQHLQRLMSQNTINFTAPNASSISKYLAVLSLMENCPVSLDDLISLYLFNQHDLRKTLHELQFFIQSGGDHKQQLSGNIASHTSEQGMSKQQKTPQKQSEQGEMFATGQYFASPGKRSLSEDTQSSGAVHDEQLKRETHQQQQSTEDELYVHRTLFEFYTVDQNAKWRIPFPVNFDLFYVNLSDIFAGSKKLKTQEDTNAVNKSTISKRKTRSPKKVWLSTATANSDGHRDEKCKNSEFSDSLNALSCFYNNVSIATSVVARDECVGFAAKESWHARDRLMPYLSESIAHDILENAINVNLEAEMCPYNLFESRKKSFKLCDLMGPTMAMLPKRTRFVDFEPALRAICRSELNRATQERRSTRFYHYLRSSCVDNSNFSQQPFESVCSIFQDQQDLSADDHTISQQATASETIQPTI